MSGAVPPMLRRILPGLDTALSYRRSWLWPDLRAGLVLTSLLIPAGIGYAQAAGLPAHAGLYATVFPAIAYALLGPSRILVFGPDSSLAPIIAAAILPLALGDEQRAVGLAGLLAIMVGAVLLAAGLARLGFVTDLLSKPIRIGYLNGVGLLVIISQLPKLLGISIDADGPLPELVEIATKLGGIDPLAAAFGLGSLALILLVRFTLRDRVPGVFVAVVVATAVVALLGLEQRLPVTGAMPQGLPAPGLSGVEWQDVLELAAPALGIALIAFADTGVLSRSLAAKRGESVDGSQEMIGLGVANMAGGAFGGFPISASASRTPVAEHAGATTQLAPLTGAALVVLFMLLAPGVTGYLPTATLAAVVIVAAWSLFDLHGLARLWRADRMDAALSLAAFLGVFLVGVLQGILVAIALSLVAFVNRAWRPYKTELGYVRGVRGYHDRARHADAQRIPGVLIVRFDAPLFFANGGIFDDYVRGVVQEAVREAERNGSPPIRTVIVAAEPITDIDTTAIDELLELDEYLRRHGMTLVLAEVKGPVKDRIRRFGLADRFPPERFAPTVGAAVDAITGTLRYDIVKDEGPGADARPQGPGN